MVKKSSNLIPNFNFDVERERERDCFDEWSLGRMSVNYLLFARLAYKNWNHELLAEIDCQLWFGTQNFDFFGHIEFQFGWISITTTNKIYADEMFCS